MKRLPLLMCAMAWALLAAPMAYAQMPNSLVGGSRFNPPPPSPVCTENLNPDVVMMKSAEYRVRTDDSSALNRARDRRIFIQ